MRQATDTILMIRPVQFRMNEETAVNNYFQEEIDETENAINIKAQIEFDNFVLSLRKRGINILVVNDNNEDTPDSLFPNNWVSFHADGQVCLYPMFAENRRRERNHETLIFLKNQGFLINKIVDYTLSEHDNLFLEGTGSLILDRAHNKVYCALSDRADRSLVDQFCTDHGCTSIIFNSFQTVEGQRLPIYHTNVMMCLGVEVAVICIDAIDDETEKSNVLYHLEHDYKDIVYITESQMHQFAGNMLQVCDAQGKLYLVMSSSAYNSLAPEQIAIIEKSSEIIHSDLETIETCGGGSARCMMAEVFLPKV